MKLFKGFKKYPFLLLAIISALIFSAIGFIGKNSTYAGYSSDLLKIPQLAVVFEGIGDGKYPWEVLTHLSLHKKSVKTSSEANDASGKSESDEGNIKDNTNSNGSRDNSADKNSNIINKTKKNSQSTYENKNDKDAGSNDVKGSKSGISDGSGSNRSIDDPSKDSQNTKAAGNKANDVNNQMNPSDKDGSDKNDSDSKSSASKNDKPAGKDEGNNSKKSSSSAADFQTVKKSYFNDALFIGDSRTVGLSEYSGWSKPAFYADIGLTIYDVFEKKVASVDGHKTTIDKALEKQSFGKIYIMLGINELGTGDTKGFIKEYKSVVSKIEKLQPNAIIFVEGIMYVSKKKSDTDPIFNNRNITDKNDHLSALADNKRIFYIDVNDAIADDTGSLPAKYTFDDIHLKAAYYKIWTEFLLKHGIALK